MPYTARSYRWVLALAAGLLFSACLLRALVTYRDDPHLFQVLSLLLAWLLLFVSQPLVSGRWPAFFPFYLVLQSALILALLNTPIFIDYFAVLFGVLSIQCMQYLRPRYGAAVIGFFTPLMIIALAQSYGVPKALGLGLVYTALNLFLATYALVTQRAVAAGAQNLSLAAQLRDANAKLEAYSRQVEQLAVTRERHRLARELHDSVTQTIFSMSLTNQSALLLLERDPGRASAQLERMRQLAQTALSEMHMLMSELRPEQVPEGGLVMAIRRYLADCHLPETLSVAVEVEGDQQLAPEEQQAIFKIVQEALNNIVKHAQASQARIRLHLCEPWWVEVQDQGRGFDLSRARTKGGVGLASMAERAAEIGWELRITSTAGAGTRIRIEKMPTR